jgi:hypothetical protein
LNRERETDEARKDLLKAARLLKQGEVSEAFYAADCAMQRLLCIEGAGIEKMLAAAEDVHSG